MLLIFPIIYLLAFLFSAKELINGNKQGILLFLTFGLAIYTTTLSVLFNLGLRELIVFFQPLKEILVIAFLGICLWNYKQKLIFHPVDYLVGAFFLYGFIYLFIPMSGYNFAERLSAFKSSSFFVLLYASGRLISIREIYVSKNFKYILLTALAAAALSLFEALSNQHLQTLTGYAEYNYYIYDQEPTGNYGLAWTFEAQSGLKRFASFFSNPLEHAAATLLALAVWAGLYTYDNNKIKLDLFGKITLIATQISIFMALSRASLVSYFIMIYVYALLTKKKKILHLYYLGLGIIIIYFVYFIQNEELYDFVIDTLTFENGSSVGHVIEWIAGIEAMIGNPLGLGLGSSGKVAISYGLNVGGENQFIIIGVQLGLIGFLLYLFLQIAMIAYPWKWINKLSGKERKIALTIFLLKVGSIIPLLTAEFESYIYISYFTWFLSGLFIHILSHKNIASPKAHA